MAQARVAAAPRSSSCPAHGPRHLLLPPPEPGAESREWGAFSSSACCFLQALGFVQLGFTGVKHGRSECASAPVTLGWRTQHARLQICKISAL